MTATQGFLYAATGLQFTREAILSIESLHTHMPDASVTIITEHHGFIPIDKVCVIEMEKTQKIDLWKSNLHYKIKALSLSPYEKTLFVDSDTYFCDSVQELFDALQFFDIMAMPSYIDCQRPFFKNRFLDGITEINTGVIAYRNNKSVKSFLKTWESCFKNNYDKYVHDQPAFSEAILDSDIRFYPLSNIYNFRIAYASRAPRKSIKIIHGRGFNFPEVAQTLNKSNEDRVWFPAKKKMICATSLSYTRRLLRNIPGFYVLKKLLKKK